MLYLNGLLLGMTLQLSLGPVFFAVLHKALTEGSREAAKMTLGAALIDAFYIGLSFTGIAFLLQLKYLQGVVLIFGAFILIIFGLSYIKKALKGIYEVNNEEKSRNNIQDSQAAEIKSPHGSSLAYGLKLTAVNPLTIIFWSGTFGALISAGILGSTKEALLYAAGSVSATLIFLGALSFLAPYAPFDRIRNMERILNYLVGAVLFVFGIFMLYRFFYLIFK